MADEDGNYDDYMMSDEEEMGVIEMEDETEEENESISEKNYNLEFGSVRSSETKTVNETSFEIEFNLAKSYEEEHDFSRARKLYNDIFQYDDENSSLLELRFRSIVEILRSWSTDTHYYRISEEICGSILADFNAFIEFSKSYYHKLNSTTFRKTVISLLTDLFPYLSREFLFAVEIIDQESLFLKMQLQIECLELFENSIEKDIIPSDIIKFGIVTARVWYGRLKTGQIRQDDVSILQMLCNGGDQTSRIDIICLIIQCCIYEFIANATCHIQTWIKYLGVLEELASKSIAASQKIGLMIQLHLSKAILILVDCNFKDNVIEVPRFHEKVRILRTEFWQCLQHMEEIGGSKQNFELDYEKFILTGFTFANMILYSIDENRINPFDFEQVKIAHGAPIVKDLQGIYQNFTALKLTQLYDSIQLLGNLKVSFDGVIEIVYHLGQIIKLWTKIAPVYACISFADVQEMLKLNNSRRMTRDGLLTILMKSIMSDTADIFYKLDLTKDLIHFGDENKVQLSMYPKESFQLNQKGTRDIEFANNVGIYDNPASLRNLTPLEFFDNLQSSRDNVLSVNRNHEPPPTNSTIVTSSSAPIAPIQQGSRFQPIRVRYTNAYNELSDLIRARLNF